MTLAFKDKNGYIGYVDDVKKIDVVQNIVTNEVLKYEIQTETNSYEVSREVYEAVRKYLDETEEVEEIQEELMHMPVRSLSM